MHASLRLVLVLSAGVLLPVSARGQSSICAVPTTASSSNNGGSVGGILYFDLTVVNPIKVTGFHLNYSVGAGAAVGVVAYVTPGTHVGAEEAPSLWTQVATDDGNGLAAGVGLPTELVLQETFSLQPGSYGVALIAVNAGHKYTNGTGANENYSNADVSMTCGSAQNSPFVGIPFTPRVMNGCIDYGPDCFVIYGNGCPGEGGFVPHITTFGCAVGGQPIQFQASNMLGGTTATLFFGTSQGEYLMGWGCYLNVGGLLPINVSFPVGGSGPGNGQVIFAGLIPASASGLTLSVQIFQLDAATALGFANSNGLAIEIE